VLKRDDAILSELMRDSDDDYEPHGTAQEIGISECSNMDQDFITDENDPLPSSSTIFDTTMTIQIPSVEQPSAALTISEPVSLTQDKISKALTNNYNTSPTSTALEISDDCNRTIQLTPIKKAQPSITRRVTRSSALEEQSRQSLPDKSSISPSRFVDLDPEIVLETTVLNCTIDTQRGNDLRTYLPQSRNNGIETTSLVTDDEMDDVDQLEFTISASKNRSSSRGFKRGSDNGCIISETAPARKRYRKPPASSFHAQDYRHRKPLAYADEGVEYDITESQPLKAMPHTTNDKRKQPESEAFDLEYSEQAFKKARNNVSTHLLQEKGILIKTEPIDVDDSEFDGGDSDTESEEDIVALKPTLPNTGNEFPRFSSGDVYISLNDTREYRLHSQILQVRSQWFKDALKLTPKEASNAYLQEPDERAAKEFRQKSKLKFRFEILGKPKDIQMTRAVSTLFPL
jgi:hypothetical protein